MFLTISSRGHTALGILADLTTVMCTFFYSHLKAEFPAIHIPVIPLNKLSKGSLCDRAKSSRIQASVSQFSASDFQLFKRRISLRPQSQPRMRWRGISSFMIFSRSLFSGDFNQTGGSSIIYPYYSLRVSSPAFRIFFSTEYMRAES